jgi:hypothetical protein
MTVYGIAVWHKGRSKLYRPSGRLPRLFLTRWEARKAIEYGDATRPRGYVLRPVKMELKEVKVR